MAEEKNVKPTASNKYSLYAGREETVNWGQVAVDLTKGLNVIKAQRDSAKQKIIDDTNSALNELSEIADVQSGSMNSLLIDGSDFSKNTLQTNMDLVRRGILNPKDYMLIMQQQKDGYKSLSNYAKNYAAFKGKIQQATSFITQAISGAAVSEQEAKRITKLIPQLGDTEATFEGKMKALDGYFADAIKIAENNNADFTTAMEIMEQSGQGAENYLDMAGEVSLKKDGDVIDVSAN